MKKKLQYLKMFVCICIFSGLIIGGLGAAIRVHTGNLVKGGKAHIKVTEAGVVYSQVKENRIKHRSNASTTKDYETRYEITWYQKIGIVSEDTPMTEITIDVDSRTMSHYPEPNDLTFTGIGYQKGEVADIYIQDDGRAFPGDRIDTNAVIAEKMILAGIIAEIIGILLAFIGFRLSKKQDVKPKGLNEMLKEDPSLTQKMTYEEATDVKYGFSDDGLEDAYREYKEVLGREDEEK